MEKITLFPYTREASMCNGKRRSTRCKEWYKTCYLPCSLPLPPLDQMLLSKKMPPGTPEHIEELGATEVKLIS